MVQACWLPCCLMPCFKRDRKTVDMILFSYQCPSCVSGTGYPQEAQKRWHLVKHPFCSFSWVKFPFPEWDFLNFFPQTLRRSWGSTRKRIQLFWVLAYYLPSVLLNDSFIFCCPEDREQSRSTDFLLSLWRAPQPYWWKSLECRLLLSTTNVSNVSEYWFIRN